jgi:hypothetical protein
MNKVRIALTAVVLASAMTACTPQQVEAKAEVLPEITAADVLSDARRAAARHNWTAAIMYLDEVVAQYPDSPEANTARMLADGYEAEKARAVELVAASRQAAENRRLREKWTYIDHTDPMTDAKLRGAVIESENTVEFAFPYHGVQRASLTLRWHPQIGNAAIISLREGQINCSRHTGCELLVRFDDAKAGKWRAHRDDDKSNFVFINNSRFFERVRSAKVVRVELPVHREGSPIFEFHVGGFDYEKFTGR